MADYGDRRDQRRDDRRDYRGGNGGRAPMNKRKRGDDDDVDRYPPRSQRQRHEPPPGTRIRRGLLELGEDPDRRPQDVAASIARLTADNYQDSYVHETFTTLVLKLVAEQPFRIPFVAGLVLYANAEKPAIAQDIVTKAAQQLQEALDREEWRDIKLNLRFLACLSQLFNEDGVLPILDELFNRAVDLQTASPDDTIGIELVKVILLTIPYLLANSTGEGLQQGVSELLEKTDVVASTPHLIDSLTDPYSSASTSEDRQLVSSSFIGLLQRQLQNESTKGWPLKVIPRGFDASIAAPPRPSEEAPTGDVDATTSHKLDFPAINVPATLGAKCHVHFPEKFFSLFADLEVESVPPTSDIASSLFRDATVDTINCLDFNRNAAARQLNEIDFFWTEGTFARRGTAFDRLRDIEPGRPTWKPEDIVIDAIFSQIVILPKPRHRLVYYHSLITETCKIAPQAVAPSLGRAIRALFRNLDVIDLELQYRYMDWFAHHLSNFEFRWKWTEWTPEVDQSDLNPRKAFINGILDKEIRLSFAKRIRETLPQEYHHLIPASKEKDIPEFKYNNDTTPFAPEGRELLSLLKKKAPEEEIQKVLQQVTEQANANGSIDPLVATTDIYMTCILSIGSKSLSHVLSTIDRCKERLLAIGANSEVARRQVITSVVDFWRDQPGTAVNIVDKLLNYTIVTPISVIQWALNESLDCGRSLAKTRTYELVSITMFKVTNRVQQLVAHRNNPRVPFAQRQQVDEALPRERQGMRDLFAAIEDAVSGVASGAQDGMIERFDGGEEELALIQQWGARWQRTWQRKSAVIEAFVGESAVSPLEEEEEPAEEQTFAPEPAADDVPEDMDRV